MTLGKKKPSQRRTHIARPPPAFAVAVAANFLLKWTGPISDGHADRRLDDRGRYFERRLPRPVSPREFAREKNGAHEENRRARQECWQQASARRAYPLDHSIRKPGSREQRGLIVLHQNPHPNEATAAVGRNSEIDTPHGNDK
jgi:hypothetical protein